VIDNHVINLIDSRAGDLETVPFPAGPSPDGQIAEDDIVRFDIDGRFKSRPRRIAERYSPAGSRLSGNRDIRMGYAEG
jgi:hypothetical protein